MGGQVADHGDILIPGETPCRFHVTDVQKNKGGKYMHYGKMIEGILKLGDTVTAAIDTERRQAVARAHSATHLLDKALRTVLGDHVHQAGSLVEPDRLRFDFTHFSAMTVDELKQVAEEVNNAILSGYDVHTDVLPIEEAKKRGAIALFGEKYGDTVRVVDMGNGYSVEFCGGTHLTNTAMAGPFRIVSEFSVASGVRRIEAVVGKAYMQEMDERVQMLQQVAATLKTSPEELLHKAEQAMKEMKELRQNLEGMQSRLLAGDAERFLFAAKKVEGLNIVTATLQSMDGGALRKMGDLLREKDESVVAVLSTVDGDKITFSAACGKKAVAAGIKAGDLIKMVTKVTGGSGGGKPDSAMGGGKDPLMLDNALALVDNFVADNVKK
jgi:alanyl-tRNA synthetase